MMNLKKLKNMILILNKIRYFIVAFLADLTGNKSLLKKKLLIGGILVGFVAVSSCRIKPPHKCYSPVKPDDTEKVMCYEAVIDTVSTDEEIIAPEE